MSEDILHDYAKARNLQRQMSREEVRKTWCPKCLARPNDLCMGRNKRRRASNHYERVEAAAG